MVGPVRGLLLAALGTAWLAGTAPAWARPPAVNDQANLFSPAARGQADDLLAQIQGRYHDTVLVETFERIPWYYNLNPLSRGYKNQSMDEAARAKFFADWAERRARKAGDRGIYLMIDRPGDTFHVQVAVGPGAQVREALPPAAQAALRDQLLASLKQGQADRGLLQAVRFIEDRLEAHLASSPPASVLDWVSAGWALLAILGVWLFLECLRFLRRGKTVLAPAAGGTNGGGSSLPSLFEAMTCGGVRQLFCRGASVASRPACDSGRAPVLGESAAPWNGQAGEEHDPIDGKFCDPSLDHHPDEPTPEHRP